MNRRDKYLPSNLFLNRLRIGLCKKAKQNAAEIVRVAIGIAQLISNGVNEQIAPFRVKVDS